MNACTTGLESVNTDVVCSEFKIRGLKWLIAVATARHSNSHGSHLVCPSLNLALKKLASCGELLSGREARRVAAIPGLEEQASVTNHNLSSGAGMVIAVHFWRWCCES